MDRLSVDQANMLEQRNLGLEREMRVDTEFQRNRSFTGNRSVFFASISDAYGRRSSVCDAERKRGAGVGAGRREGRRERRKVAATAKF